MPTLGSNNPFPSVLLVEGAAPASPAAGRQRLYIDTADNRLKRKTSAGAVVDLEDVPVAWQGAWDVGTAYGEGDIVEQDGSAWIATTATTGDTPGGSPSPWELFASKGDTGSTGAAGTTAISTCNGRLTTESGVPISTSDRSAQSTIYFTPYFGNQVALYSGAAWVLHTFTERSLALSGLTSGKNYDVFLYDNAGTLTLELSAAWTNDTTRANALTLQDGIYVKSGTTTRRYLGTIRTTGTTTTEDSATKRFVWNAMNQVARSLSVTDTTNSWSYTTNTWRQARASAANQVEFIVGLAGVDVDAVVIASIGQQTNSGTLAAAIAVGVNSTSTPSGIRSGGYNNSATVFTIAPASASYRGPAPLGYTFLAWLEFGIAGTTNLFYGDNNATDIQAGLVATVFM